MQEGREESRHERLHVPGTLTLVFVFLAWFVLLYVLNWMALAQLWPVQ